LLQIFGDTFPAITRVSLEQQLTFMARYRQKSRSATGASSSRGAIRWAGIISALLLIAVAVFALNRKSAPAPQPNQALTDSPAAPTNLPTTEVNQALMVTVELDFGPTMPSIADALRDIQRLHQPASGTGRVFAILDAYGEPTPDGKKLHMSMHVSTEKPGIGSLVFKRTGEVLWSSRIVPSTNAPSRFSGTALTILVDDGSGKLFTVDGSQNPASILEASIKEVGQPISEWWPEGAEREVTFIYSACGCPVKVMCRRTGDRTLRTKELPVIFPDDPSVVTLITQLMRW
jgi:hypothetical protein